MNPAIVLKRLEDIKPYEGNPRLNADAVDAVAESIRRYGVKQPLVLDKQCVIVVGHTRYLAAQKLGMEEVPCIISELSDEQNREYRLVDNKTNEAARWDFEKLTQELEGLDLGAFQFDWAFPPGIDESDIDAFFNAPDESEQKPEPVSVYGVKVFCGSAEEAQAIMDEYAEKGYEVELL